jgi:hypothetical protein
MQLIIYYTEKCFQVVKPSPHFDGNWRVLADAIAGIDIHTKRGKYLKYIVK